MMIIHGDTLIQEQVISELFLCDLEHCKGACCVEGDYGAPLDEEELEAISENLEHIKPYLTESARAEIDRRGFYEKDCDGELVTTCLPTGECNFSFRDAQGVLKCGMEQAFKDGKSSFRKPISCHLYPIRLSKVGSYTALNYHKWNICKAACSLGKRNKVSLYRFVKDALTRKFGAAWYAELERLAQQWKLERNQ
jgi:hypothetical protein